MDEPSPVSPASRSSSTGSVHTPGRSRSPSVSSLSSSVRLSPEPYGSPRASLGSADYELAHGHESSSPVSPGSPSSPVRSPSLSGGLSPTALLASAAIAPLAASVSPPPRHPPRRRNAGRISNLNLTAAGTASETRGAIKTCNMGVAAGLLSIANVCGERSSERLVALLKRLQTRLEHGLSYVLPGSSTDNRNTRGTCDPVGFSVVPRDRIPARFEKQDRLVLRERHSGSLFLCRAFQASSEAEFEVGLQRFKKVLSVDNRLSSENRLIHYCEALAVPDAGILYLLAPVDKLTTLVDSLAQLCQGVLGENENDQIINHPDVAERLAKLVWKLTSEAIVMAKILSAQQCRYRAPFMNWSMYLFFDVTSRSLRITPIDWADLWVFTGEPQTPTDLVDSVRSSIEAVTTALVEGLRQAMPTYIYQSDTAEDVLQLVFANTTFFDVSDLINDAFISDSIEAAAAVAASNGEQTAPPAYGSPPRYQPPKRRMDDAQSPSTKQAKLDPDAEQPLPSGILLIRAPPAPRGDRLAFIEGGNALNLSERGILQFLQATGNAESFVKAASWAFPVHGNMEKDLALVVGVLARQVGPVPGITELQVIHPLHPDAITILVALLLEMKRHAVIEGGFELVFHQPVAPLLPQLREAFSTATNGPAVNRVVVPPVLAYAPRHSSLSYADHRTTIPAGANPWTTAQQMTGAPAPPDATCVATMDNGVVIYGNQTAHSLRIVHFFFRQTLPDDVTYEQVNNATANHVFSCVLQLAAFLVVDPPSIDGTPLRRRSIIQEVVVPPQLQAIKYVENILPNIRSETLPDGSVRLHIPVPKTDEELLALAERI